ncbi:protein longifolia 2 [Phtheirospermum japonicum]|uniref:Protein longifolia 2 n=1 Tax=Phtheirospermum japonicum TaxID=374723 RepID=A0A830B2N4_9LAMI|nr:protein longifolia 2 [Phtheirospermum japonicum]
MYREARGLSIKPLANDEKRGTVMKHIDSPRSTRVLATSHQNTKDERLALPRFSYDGRESRETAKHKELPRLSLDSKASSMKRSGLESRLNFLGPGSHMENEDSGHNRTSSVVAKLMGLENFPDTICTNENRTQNQATYSPRVSQSNPASPSPRFQSANVVRKPNSCSRSTEPAPWRQQDPSQGSPKTATQSRKAPTNNRSLSPSVYGEIEKRVTELQFQKSGKDLRALKQILEAMQKTRERLEDPMGESNSSITKPAKLMEKVRIPVSNSKNHVEKNSAHRQKTKDLTSKNNNLKDPRQHLDRPQRKKVENCTAPGRSFGLVSPRLQQNLFRIEEQSQPTTTSSDSGRVKKRCVKKVVEKGLQNRKLKVKAKDVQLSDDQLSEISIETRYSSYQNDTASIISESNSSLVSQAALEVTSLVQKESSVSTTREHMPAVKTVVTVSEQPSPISVLDDTFYCEDSPSPVKKISTEFQADESLSPDEAAWHLDNLNHLTDCTRSNHACKHNQKLENLKISVQELSFLTEPDSTAVDHNAVLSHNPDHRYINKILLISGLLKNPSFISPTDQHLSSCHLINPDMFHVLEQTEEIGGKSDGIQLNNKNQRKIIFDMVDEILVRKVTSGKLFTSVTKKTNPQGLLKDVYLEMDRVCCISEFNLEDEDDEMIRLLTADMMYQDDWVDYNCEVPALVLDIERLLFKELINEVITSVATVLNDQPLRHCRKLFSK